jgi:hypothetical protein
MLLNQIRVKASSNTIAVRRDTGVASAAGSVGGVEGRIEGVSGARDFTAFVVACSFVKLARHGAIGYHVPMSAIRNQESVTDRCCAVLYSRTPA